MGQGTISKSIRNTLALWSLLANTRHHLRNVNGTSLGTSLNHRNKAICNRKRSLTYLTRLIKSLVQIDEAARLKFFLIRLTSIVYEKIIVELKNNFVNILLALLNRHIHFLTRAFICNKITNTNTKALHNKIIFNHTLNIINKVYRIFCSIIIIGCVNNSLAWLVKDSLVESSLHNNTFANLDNI